MVSDSELLLSAQLEALGDVPLGLAWVDRALRYQRVNPAFADLNGLPVEAHLGRAMAEVNPGVSSVALEALREVLATGATLRRETAARTPRAPGQVRQFLATFAPVRRDGEVVGAMIAVEDVTAQLESEALRAIAARDMASQQARLHAVLEQAPVMVAVLSAPELRYALANPRYRALFGGRSLVGRTAWELHPELVEQGLLQIIDRVARTGERFVGTELQARLDRGEGVLADGFFNFVYEPLRDGQGRVETVVVFASEVTDLVLARRRAERLSNELQRTDLLFQSVVNLHHAVTWTADFDGEVRPSSSWTEFAGLAPEAQLGGGWLAAVHPEDRERVSHAWREAVRTQRSFAEEARVRHRDGSHRVLALRATLVRHPDGSPREWIATGADVSAARRVDAVLAQLDRAGAELGATLELDAVLDTLARVAVPGWGELAVIDLMERGELRAARRAVAREGEVELLRERGPAQSGGAGLAAARELRPRRLGFEELQGLRDGLGPAPGSGIALPLAVRGEVLGVLTLASRDASLAAEAEQRGALQLARRGALALEHARLYADSRSSLRARDEFLAAISHELRTPLTAILGWSRLLRMRAPTPQQLEHALTIIERNAQAQARLVEDLLDLTRAATGRLRLRTRTVDPRAIVQAALDVVRPSAEARGVAVELRAAPELPAVQADPDRLQQAVWNLLGHAVRATPTGGRVRAAVERAGAVVQISVVDGGPGLAPGSEAELFERFDASPGGGATGGMGLPLVQRIAALHGGSVHAENAEQGARFVLELPALPLSAPSPANEAPSFAEVRVDGVSVLVVDDHADSRDTVRALLAERGAHVRVAGSADEALQALTERAPDVLVSDLAMPGTDGLALVQKLQALGLGRLPTLALTARFSADVDEEARGAGYTRCLAKPPEPDALLEAVAELAGAVRNER